MNSAKRVDVLLVEDSEVDAKLVMSMLALSPHDLKVEWVIDGAHAVDRLFNHDIVPRLILLDIMVPGVDGLELLYRIKRSIETRETPVIMITSMDDEKIVVSSYKLGVTAFVSKPLHRSALLEAFETAGCDWVMT